ncbi:MAG TPA: metal-dependent hydrolase [Longimicrobiales bacterium]|nr:metal-dependent hydrolase [Longimicrobiales bacterium]
MAKVTWHGHATTSLETQDGTRLVIDPFIEGNPSCELSVDDFEADYILISHGHSDHVADAIPLAKRTGATIIATYELATYMERQGLKASPHHIGGGVRYPFGYVKLTPALHGGIVELEGGEGFTSLPCGFLIRLNEGKSFHHAGDTGLIASMQLLAGQVDVAMIPIGDRYTMGPEDAVRAVEMIAPKVVIPIHYGTWPPIEQDPEAFKKAVGKRAEVEILRPGESYEF